MRADIPPVFFYHGFVVKMAAYGFCESRCNRTKQLDVVVSWLRDDVCQLTFTKRMLTKLSADSTDPIEVPLVHSFWGRHSYCFAQRWVVALRHITCIQPNRLRKRTERMTTVIAALRHAQLQTAKSHPQHFFGMASLKDLWCVHCLDDCSYLWRLKTRNRNVTSSSSELSKL